MARRTAAARLETWGLRDELDDIALVVSELVSNAVLHGDGDPTLTLELADSRLRVTVRDAGNGTPTVRAGRPDEPTGRGLRIVDRLADAWGVEAGDSDGTTVWVELVTSS